MNVKLSFTPVSQNPVDLLAVVLDDEKTLHEIDDPALQAHVQRAAAAFRDKSLKREYYATLEGSKVAKAVVVYWSPQLKSWNLWENVKTFTARALRLARDYRLARVGLVLNAKDAAPLVGKAVEGAVLGTYTFDKYRQEKDEFFAKEAVAHDPRPPRPPGGRRGAQGPLRLGLGERQPRARPHQRARQRVTPEVFAAEAGEIAREVELEVEVLDPAALRAKGYSGILRVGAGSANPGRMVVLRHVPAQGVEGDDRARRQGHHVRLRRDQPEAGRQDVGDEGRHGRRRRGALRHARPRQDPARREGPGHPVLRGEHARRQRAAAGRHLHGEERQVGHGRQHRRRGPARAPRRARPGGRGGGHPRRGHRHPDRRRRPGARAERRRGPGHRPRPRAPGHPLRARTTASPSGSCRSSRSTRSP